MNTAQNPQQTIDLDLLLDEIRLRGISVGVMELQRLQTLFKHAPQLSRIELSDLLCTVLAKNDNQQQTIERVFQRWVPFDSELAPELAPEKNLEKTQTRHTNKHNNKTSNKDRNKNSSASQKTKTKKPLNIVLIGLLGLISIALFVLLITFLNTEKQAANHSDSGAKTYKPDSTHYKHEDNDPIKNDLNLQQTITIWTPQLTISSVNLWNRVLPPLALLLGAGLGFIWLLQQALKRTRKREPDNIYMHDQRIRSYLPNLQHRLPYHLLNPQERREMGWGISHYISDQPLQQLDMARSVAESAKRGLPSIHFKQAKYERQLWLWLDRHSQNPDLLRLADEITKTLSAMNIEVQRAYFYGLPNRVINNQAKVIWSLNHQQPEHHPLLLVLMDINSLYHLNENQRQLEPQTFRQLSHWSHVAVVDCSNQAGQLHAQLKAYKLNSLLPQEVAHWLSKQGETSLKKLSMVCPLDELYRWACACALPQRPVTEAEIRALHEQLQLNCAWQYHKLSNYAQHSTQGFNFKQRRPTLLNDLAKSPDLDKALQFWITRYQEIDQILQEESKPQEPWLASLPQKQLHIDIALLQLWQKQTIDQASNTLFDLYQQDALKQDIKQKIQQLSCKGLEQSLSNNSNNDSNNKIQNQNRCFIYLPHLWQNLNINTRQQLLAIGFAGKFKYFAAKWDKLTATVLGLLAGLTLLGFAWTINNLMPSSAKIITQQNSKEPAKKIQKIIMANSPQAKVLVGTSKSLFIQKPIKSNQLAQVYWTPTLTHAQKKLSDNSQLWLLGSKVNPEKPKDWFDFSAAIIKAKAGDNHVQQLAARLLDSGSVDQLLISNSERLTPAELKIKQQWKNAPNNQIVTIEKEEISGLLKKLQKTEGNSEGDSVIEFKGKKLMAPKSKSSNALAKKKIIKLANNLKLIPLPRGEFQMGSTNGGEDEKPVHKVTINYDLWISQTEITFEQYDSYAKATGKYNPSDGGWGRKNRPVINVSWDDAQGYIKWLNKTNKNTLQGLQCRLPSEAEWEYAARAGTTTEYSWGNKIGNNNANCDGCGSQWDNKQTAPVASFSANQFGLYDMHGNVFEWVEDCYHDNYQNAPDNGTVWQKAECDSRVLRGDSWNFNPYDLLPAYRPDDPDLRVNLIGFRVVCSLPFTEN